MHSVVVRQILKVDETSKDIEHWGLLHVELIFANVDLNIDKVRTVFLTGLVLCSVHSSIIINNTTFFIRWIFSLGFIR